MIDELITKYPRKIPYDDFVIGLNAYELELETRGLRAIGYASTVAFQLLVCVEKILRDRYQKRTTYYDIHMKLALQDFCEVLSSRRDKKREGYYIQRGFEYAYTILVNAVRVPKHMVFFKTAHVELTRKTYDDVIALLGYEGNDLKAKSIAIIPK